MYASERFGICAPPFIRAYSERKGKEGARELTVTDVFPKMIFDGELYRDDVNKVSYLLPDYAYFSEAKKAFPDLENGTWGGAGETALFGDLGVKGISKAKAIEKLLSYLGAAREDTIAFGDAKGDIPMLAYCAVGVAMGNGSTQIKAMADFVTDRVDEDGLSKAFQRLGLTGR